MADQIYPMQVCAPVKFTSYQFTRASEATYYNPAGILTIATVDEIRYGYDPATEFPIGYIIENAATNVLSYSNDFTNAVWVKNTFNTVSVTTSTELAPDASDYQLLTATSIPARVERDVSAFSGTYVFSVHVKKKSGTGFFTMSGCGSGVFDLSSGTIIAGDNATIQELKNGSYRCSISGTIDDLITISSTAAFEIYAFGAQLEAGSYVTTYIYTDSTAETRAADVAGDPPYLISSNIPEDDYADYNPLAAYVTGNKVMVRDNIHRNYQAITSSTGMYPPTNVGQWLDIGATERWRMFDTDVGSDLQSINTGTIDVSVKLAGPVNTLSLLNIQGVTATVRMYSQSNVLIYEMVVPLLTDPPVAGWYEYLFGRRYPLTNITLTDLPEEENTSIQVIIAGDDEDSIVALGKFIVGEAITIGFTEYGSSVGITDYSTKEVDDFGNYYIVERRFTGKAELKVVVDPGYEDTVYNLLAELRATPSLYIGHKNYNCTIIYGFFTDFSILFSTPASSYCNLTVTGI